MRLRADLQLADGGSTPVTIDNLSAEGCCIEGQYQIGDRIDLIVPTTGRVQGHVRWSIGGRAGIRFLSVENGSVGVG